MEQAVRMGKIRYEVEIVGAENAQVTIKNLNLRLKESDTQLKEQDRTLSRFIARNKLGWAAVAFSIGGALREISKGSTFLTDVIKTPATLLQTLGTAIDIALPEEMAAFETWLARTQADIIEWGAEMGEADNKVQFLGKSIGELAGKTVVVTVKTVLEATDQFSKDIIDGKADPSDFGSDVTAGILEAAGLNPDDAARASDVQGALNNLYDPQRVVESVAYLREQGIADGSINVWLSRGAYAKMGPLGLLLAAADSVGAVGSAGGGQDEPFGWIGQQPYYDANAFNLQYATEHGGREVEYGDRPRGNSVVINNHFYGDSSGAQSTWTSRNQVSANMGGD